MKRSRLILMSLLSILGLTFASAQDPVTITHWTDPALATPPHHPEPSSRSAEAGDLAVGLDQWIRRVSA